MFTTLSTARRFHVVSFVLTLVCFAAMLLYCQNLAVGQNVSGKETAVAANADVGENSSGGQEEGTAENPSDQSDSEKDKQTDSNSQENAAKTAADEENQNKDQNADSLIASQDYSQIWQNVKDFQEKYWSYIYLVFAFFNIVICIAWSLWLKPMRRKQRIEKYNEDFNEFKDFALECIKLGFSNKDSEVSEKIDFVSHENAELIVQQRLNKITGQEPEKKRRTWTEFFVGLFTRKKTTYLPISEDDAYLLIVTIGFSEEDFKKNLDKHRKVVCQIYDKRYNAYWKHWFKNVTFWSVIILLLPFVLNILPSVIYHILKIFKMI